MPKLKAAPIKTQADYQPKRVVTEEERAASTEARGKLKAKEDEAKLRFGAFEEYGKDVEVKQTGTTFSASQGMIPRYSLVDKKTGEQIGTQNWTSPEEAQAGKAAYVQSKIPEYQEKEKQKSEFSRKEAVSDILRQQYPGWDKAASNTKEANFKVLDEFAKMAGKDTITPELASQLFSDPKFKEKFEGTTSQVRGELNKADNAERRTRVASYIVAAASVLGPLTQSILPALAVSAYGKKMGVDPALIASSGAISGVGAVGETARQAALAAGPQAPQGPTPSGQTLDTAQAVGAGAVARTGLTAAQLAGTAIGAAGQYIGAAQERTAAKESQQLAKTEKLTALESEEEKAKRKQKELELTQPEERTQLTGQKTQQERQIAQLKAAQDKEDIEAAGSYIKKRIAGSGVQQKLKARLETGQAAELATQEQALGEITRKQELLPKLQALDTEAAQQGLTNVEQAQAFVPAEENVQDKARRARLRAGYARGGAAVGATILSSL